MLYRSPLMLRHSGTRRGRSTPSLTKRTRDRTCLETHPSTPLPTRRVSSRYFEPSTRIASRPVPRRPLALTLPCHGQVTTDSRGLWGGLRSQQVTEHGQAPRTGSRIPAPRHPNIRARQSSTSTGRSQPRSSKNRQLPARSLPKSSSEARTHNGNRVCLRQQSPLHRQP